MALIHSRFAGVVVLAVAALPMASGCDSSTGGSSDMDAMVAQMDQSERAAQAAAEAAARKAEEEKTKAQEAEAARLAAEQAAAATKATEQAPAPENETTITITVKNPQGLLANEDAKAQAEEMMEEFGPTSGRRGQSFHDDGQGYLFAVFSARFVAENRLVMAQIKKNMDLFEATNGRKPTSHEEFWQAIIVDGGVALPELEEGEEYFYDVKNDVLMVKTPAPQ
jgi:hypothetical protein